jgi:hypothetical protein
MDIQEIVFIEGTPDDVQTHEAQVLSTNVRPARARGYSLPPLRQRPEHDGGIGPSAHQPNSEPKELAE